MFGKPISIEHHDEKIELEDLKRKFAFKVGCTFDDAAKAKVLNGAEIASNSLFQTRKYLKSHRRVLPTPTDDLVVVFGDLKTK